MREDATDQVRLTLPPDADLRGVVEVAVAVLARRVGLDDPAVREARSAAGEAFDEACADAGPNLVEVELSLGQRDVGATIRSGSIERRIRATRSPSDPPR
jgi:hypothetical protein